MPFHCRVLTACPPFLRFLCPSPLPAQPLLQITSPPILNTASQTRCELTALPLALLCCRPALTLTAARSALRVSIVGGAARCLRRCLLNADAVLQVCSPVSLLPARPVLLSSVVRRRRRAAAERGGVRRVQARCGLVPPRPPAVLQLAMLGLLAGLQADRPIVPVLLRPSLRAARDGQLAGAGGALRRRRLRLPAVRLPAHQRQPGSCLPLQARAHQARPGHQEMPSCSRCRCLLLLLLLLHRCRPLPPARVSVRLRGLQDEQQLLVRRCVVRSQHGVRESGGARARWSACGPRRRHAVQEHGRHHGHQLARGRRRLAQPGCQQHRQAAPAGQRRSSSRSSIRGQQCSGSGRRRRGEAAAAEGREDAGGGRDAAVRARLQQEHGQRSSRSLASPAASAACSHASSPLCCQSTRSRTGLRPATPSSSAPPPRPALGSSQSASPAASASSSPRSASQREPTARVRVASRRASASSSTADSAALPQARAGTDVSAKRARGSAGRG